MTLDHSTPMFSGKQIHIKTIDNRETGRLIINMGGSHQSFQIMLHHRPLPETVIKLSFTFKCLAQ